MEATRQQAYAVTVHAPMSMPTTNSATLAIYPTSLASTTVREFAVW